MRGREIEREGGGEVSRGTFWSDSVPMNAQWHTERGVRSTGWGWGATGARTCYKDMEYVAWSSQKRSELEKHIWKS